MQRIRDRIEAVRSRQQTQWLWQTISVGMVAGGVIGCGLAVARVLGAEFLSVAWIALAVAGCPAIGLAYGSATARRSRDAAVAIDRQYRLQDRIATALAFVRQPEPRSPLHQLQIDDAEARVAQLDPVHVAPVRMPSACGWGLALSATAFLLAFVSAPREELKAAVAANQVVVRQAVRVAEGLEELERFNQEIDDPAIEQLLEELAAKIEELKQPGVDPKEALAKLSEMEAALQETQEQLADPGTEAALQAIGEALALAEPFQAAGQAMSQGDMEQAAEELAKLDLPELDRQTERAVTEKLDQAQQNCSQAAQRRLREATAQVCSGLVQGDRSKFKEGVEGLAGECKKQGRRKKLRDLLRRQCNCLCECKSECEGACQSEAESKAKGGNKWGLARSGNEPGDSTPNLKTGPQLQVTGVESEGGDVDVQTMSSPEEQQQARRQYQQKLERYEQISESVLQSEPIPLGHRQTIRRYFELIRPQNAETDAVFSETSEAAAESR
jgi:hypothetical protein